MYLVIFWGVYICVCITRNFISGNLLSPRLIDLSFLPLFMSDYFPRHTVEAASASYHNLNGTYTRQPLSYLFPWPILNILRHIPCSQEPRIILSTSLCEKFQCIFQKTRHNDRQLINFCLRSLEGIYRDEIEEEVLGR